MEKTDVRGGFSGLLAFLAFLFDWRGRISRLAYLGGVLLVALAQGLLTLHLDPAVGGGQATVAIWVLSILLLWVSLALGAKRLHDINWSGYVLVVPLALRLADLAGVLGSLPADILFGAITMILLFIGGEPHANRFGLVPGIVLREKTADPA